MVTSVMCFCLSTHIAFREKSWLDLVVNTSLKCQPQEVARNPKLYQDCTTLPNRTLVKLDIVLNLLFTVEFLLKILLAPDKRKFLCNLVSLLDALILGAFWAYQITYYFSYVHTKGRHIREGNESVPWLLNVLSTVQALRMLRIFKISKISRGLRVLILTVKKSIPELVLLGFLLMNGMFMFSSMIYMAEYSVNDTFRDIPEAFWWSLITLTTVGYGDAYPKGGWGYLVGSIAAISGCVVTGLAIPIIGNNFNTYYKYMQNQLKEDKYLRQLCRDFKETAAAAAAVAATTAANVATGTRATSDRGGSDAGSRCPGDSDEPCALPTDRRYLQLRSDLKTTSISAEYLHLPGGFGGCGTSSHIAKRRLGISYSAIPGLVGTENRLRWPSGHHRTRGSLSMRLFVPGVLRRSMQSTVAVNNGDRAGGGAGDKRSRETGASKLAREYQTGKSASRILSDRQIPSTLAPANRNNSVISRQQDQEAKEPELEDTGLPVKALTLAIPSTNNNIIHIRSTKNSIINAISSSSTSWLRRADSGQTDERTVLSAHGAELACGTEKLSSPSYSQPKCPAPPEPMETVLPWKQMGREDGGNLLQEKRDESEESEEKHSRGEPLHLCHSTEDSQPYYSLPTPTCNMSDSNGSIVQLVASPDQASVSERPAKPGTKAMAAAAAAAAAAKTAAMTSQASKNLKQSSSHDQKPCPIEGQFRSSLVPTDEMKPPLPDLSCSDVSVGQGGSSSLTVGADSVLALSTTTGLTRRAYLASSKPGFQLLTQTPPNTAAELVTSLGFK